MGKMAIVEYQFILDTSKTFSHLFELDNLLAGAFANAGMEAVNVETADKAKKYVLIRLAKTKIEEVKQPEVSTPAKKVINEMRNLNKFRT